MALVWMCEGLRKIIDCAIDRVQDSKSNDEIDTIEIKGVKHDD